MKNCKVLAMKVKSFKVRKIIRILLRDLKRYKRFFETSYKGFYCELCDARKHRFVDMNKKNLIFSKNFCRQMLKDSFHVLKYFGSNFTELLNLMLTFVTTCNYKGRFRELNFNETLTFKKNMVLED